MLLSPSWSPSLPPSSASSSSSSASASASPSSPQPFEAASAEKSQQLQQLHPSQVLLLRAQHPQCTDCTLAHNALTALCSLQPLAQLIRLDVSHNRLSDDCLPHLAALSRLEALSLAHNRIRTMRALPALPALRSLDASWNALAAFGAAFVFRPLTRHCPSLERLALHGNPGARPEATYRLRALRGLSALRRLQWLDGQPTVGERTPPHGGRGAAVEEEGEEEEQEEDEEEQEEQEQEEDAADGHHEIVESARGPFGTERKAAAVAPSQLNEDAAAVPFALQAADEPAAAAAGPGRFVHSSPSAAAMASLSASHRSPSARTRPSPAGRPWPATATVPEAGPRLDALRREAAALQRLLEGEDQRREDAEDKPGAAASVDAKGLSVWRAAMCRLLVRHADDQEGAARLRDDLHAAQLARRAERQRDAREISALTAKLTAERLAVGRTGTALSDARAELARARQRLDDSERGAQRRRSRAAEALSVVRGAQALVEAALVRCGVVERRMADLSTRLLFATHRVLLVHAMRRAAHGASLSSSQSRENGTAQSLVANSSALPSLPPAVEDAAVCDVDQHAPLRHELRRLREDRALLLAQSAESGRRAREEAAARVRADAERALAEAEATRARASLSRQHEALQEAVDSARAEAERRCAERCERTAAELSAARADAEVQRRATVALTAELRALQVQWSRAKEQQCAQEDDLRQNYEERLRATEQRLERSERDRDELRARWRRLLPDHTAVAMRKAEPPAQLQQSQHRPSPTADSAQSSAVPPPLSSRLQSLARLSQTLLSSDDEDGT